MTANFQTKTIAIIPARGGSKGISGKNIRMIAGKPLIAYSIEQAFGTDEINRVIVSTDDNKIADVAAEFKAEVIMRPIEISGDNASSESALLHVLDFLSDEENYEPDLVVFLQATSPLRASDDIHNAINLFHTEEADSLFSGNPSHGFLWNIEKGVLNSLTYNYTDRPIRQQIPEEFVENGSIYIFKPWVLREKKNRLGGKISIYKMKSIYSFQIDTEDDLNMIEKLAPITNDSGHVDLSNIQLLVSDFDGVMTDNRVMVDQDGNESVWCNRGDGMGVSMLRDAGVEVLVLSTEANSVVAARCKKLNIECVQNSKDKLEALKEIADKRGLNPEQIAYIGNDINDLRCMEWVGTAVSPADGEQVIKNLSKIVTIKNGGYGVVRELASLILKGR